MAQLCIDVGEVRTDDGEPVLRAPMHEIELELEAGDPRRLYELAQTLAADVPLAFEPATKAERGYALRQPTQCRARARRRRRACRASAPPARRSPRSCAACLAQIEGNAQGVLAGDDPEWIHQMRIGVRRLRACLSLARRGIATARIEPLRVELRWLAQSLGPARDLDVFVTSTLPAFREAVARGSGAALAPRRWPSLPRARPRAGAKRASTRARRSPRRASCAWCSRRRRSPRRPRSRERARTTRSSPEPARDFARPLLKRRHHALVALGTDLAHAAPEARHAARLAAKKLRYATEFFASLYPQQEDARLPQGARRAAGRARRVERRGGGGARSPRS